MNKIENRFYQEFHKSMDLVSQPRIYKNSVVFYRPDFLDLNTNIYYEIIGSKQAYYRHEKAKHFDIMIEQNKTLIIAIYFKHLDTFFLLKWLGVYGLPLDDYLQRIEYGMYKRRYGDSTVVYDSSTLSKPKFKAKTKSKSKPKIIQQYSYFNSKLEIELYKYLKIEAIKLNKTIRNLITDILRDYVKSKLKEKS